MPAFPLPTPPMVLHHFTQFPFRYDFNPIHPLHEQNFLLDVRSQHEKVQQLGDTGAGQTESSGRVGTVNVFAVVDDSLRRAC